MTWIKQNENSYIHDTAPFSIIKQNEIWYVVDSRDQSKAVPYDDIFNNPVYDIDFSSKSLLAKHFRAEGVNTPGTPGFSFQGDINSGIYRIGEDRIGFSAGGVKQGEFGVGYGGFTGNIIQAQFSSLSTPINTSNTTFQATGLSVSITPRYNNSKILIFGNIQGAWNNGSYISMRMLRDTNLIYTFSDLGYSGMRSGSIGFNFLDSPSTINTINYNIQYKSYGAGTSFINDYGSINVLSTITALEVQQ